MVKIGLVDVDGHNFPNLALMKLSAYHKDQGHSVEWVNPLFGSYDVVYQSKVFTFTEDFNTCIRADQIIKGGTGYGLDNKLPPEVEHIMPDYGLCGITDTAYGFLTRGCPRGCKFCIVGCKEGLKAVQVADLSEFWDGQPNIKLLDPNLLASADKFSLLRQLAESRAMVDFTQGLDARLITDHVVRHLNDIKIKNIHFAWDDMQQSDAILHGLQLYAQYAKRKIKGTWWATVYVLTNFGTTLADDLQRIYTLRDMQFRPYVMIYDKYNAPQEIRHLQRWCNNPLIFNTVRDFKDYNSKIA